jgi:hypothetical protein
MKKYLTKFFIVLLSLMLLAGGLVLGIILMVSYHPDLIGWTIGGASIIYFSLLYLAIRYLQNIFSGNDKHTQKLMKTGVRALATILNIESTAWRVNYNPVVRLSLHVNSSTRPAFDAKIETAFPIYKPFQIGDKIEVVYNPENILEIRICK